VFGLERGGETKTTDRAEKHLLRSIVDGKTAFPEHIHSNNRVQPVSEDLRLRWITNSANIPTDRLVLPWAKKAALPELCASEPLRRI
jgi:hypothetical protein